MGCGTSKFDAEEALAPNYRLNPLRRRTNDDNLHHQQHHNRPSSVSSSAHGNVSTTKQQLLDRDSAADTEDSVGNDSDAALGHEEHTRRRNDDKSTLDNDNAIKESHIEPKGRPFGNNNKSLSSDVEEFNGGGSESGQARKSVSLSLVTDTPVMAGAIITRPGLEDERVQLQTPTLRGSTLASSPTKRVDGKRVGKDTHDDFEPGESERDDRIASGPSSPSFREYCVDDGSNVSSDDEDASVPDKFKAKTKSDDEESLMPKNSDPTTSRPEGGSTRRRRGLRGVLPKGRPMKNLWNSAPRSNNRTSSSTSSQSSSQLTNSSN